MGSRGPKTNIAKAKRIYMLKKKGTKNIDIMRDENLNFAQSIYKYIRIYESYLQKRGEQ